MAQNKALCDKYDLSSVKCFFTGAAPLGRETAVILQKQYPDTYIKQGYGMLHQRPRAMLHGLFANHLKVSRRHLRQYAVQITMILCLVRLDPYYLV